MSKTPEDIPYCGILMKPDVYRRGLYQPIVDEFTHLGFCVHQRCDLILGEDDVTFLYPTEIELPVARRKLTAYLTSGVSSLVLLEPGPNRTVLSGIAILQDAKGNKEQGTGIRTKYDEIQITSEELSTKTGRYYNYMMINCFHVFDTPEHLSGFIDRRNIKVI